MPDLTGFPALDLAIGLSFVFFLLAILASTLQEFIAAVLGLRARTLEQGLRSLLEDPDKGWKVVDAFYDHELVQSLYRTKAPKAVTDAAPRTKRLPRVRARVTSIAAKLTRADARKARRNAVEAKEAGRKAYTQARGPIARAGAFFGRTSGPSYVSPRVFAEVVLDTFLPDKRTAIRHQTELNEFLDKLPAALQERVRPLATGAVTDVTKFRKHIEGWYDDTMARVSGWYKRKSQIILLVIGALMVVAINANTLTIGERLWKDPQVRAAVVAKATALASATPSATPTPAPADSKLSKAAQQLNLAADDVNDVRKVGVPMGWSGEAKPQLHNLHDWIMTFGGWLLTIAAISLGAPFWFDLLGRFSRLRSSGKPETPLPATGRGLENERVREPK
jgi:hypothetical protein